MSNPLLDFFNQDDHRLIFKWKHYFDIYHRHFSQYRDKEVTIVEIGIFHGGSLQMWKDYFGPKARIIGVDINPACKQFEEDQIEIVIGSQEDPRFLKQLADFSGPIDILIDDGGHTMKQQLTTFAHMYPRVKDFGTYLVEDLHTSYHPNYGGGLDKDTFINFSKRILDQMHSWYTDDLKVDFLTRSVYSMHCYDSVIVFDKRPIDKPGTVQKGTKTEGIFDVVPRKQ